MDVRKPRWRRKSRDSQPPTRRFKFRAAFDPTGSRLSESEAATILFLPSRSSLFASFEPSCKVPAARLSSA
ncbi:hypothetical protein JTE90_011483 [Oedothorax gibbosus]|uniref:Uncharacterized protein n=1 Tax=Oedothorax gibbosus TaxID=931172 RepID=A0AAV6VE39_9ARAC|nr:hypothetical protein JTE90_011483 [Oedothorax gibbosus]